MKKEIIILGDTELGTGNITDDFISDRALSQLILKLSKKKHAVDLIMNGDTFDFLKAPAKVGEKARFPRHVTHKVSLNKLRLMHKAHKRVFDAWKIFAKKKNKTLYFIIGNHDQDLTFKEVQKELRELIGRKIKFAMRYTKHKMFVEHGHQYDIFNKFVFKNPFWEFNKDKILAMSFISMGVISTMIPLKHEHPLMERINPTPVLFHFHKKVKKEVLRRSFDYFFKSFVYFPIRYILDPTYKVPFYLVKQVMQQFRQFNFEIGSVINQFLKTVGIRKEYNIYVFSHIHNKIIEKRKDVVFIHPDCWRDEYCLNKKTKLVSAKKKKYVQVIVNDKKTTWSIKTWPIKRSVWRFNDMVRDEKKYLRLARKEEGYLKKDFSI